LTKEFARPSVWNKDREAAIVHRMHAHRAVDRWDNRKRTERTYWVELCYVPTGGRLPAAAGMTKRREKAAGRGHRWRNGAGHPSPSRRENASWPPPRPSARPRRPSGTVRPAKSSRPRQSEAESTGARDDPPTGPGLPARSLHFRSSSRGPNARLPKSCASQTSGREVRTGSSITQWRPGKQLAKAAQLPVLNFFRFRELGLRVLACEAKLG
jgi:hypothetical protein